MSAAAPVPSFLVGVYEWAEKVEYSAFGTAIAESRYAFAIIENRDRSSLLVEVRRKENGHPKRARVE